MDWATRVAEAAQRAEQATGRTARLAALTDLIGAQEAAQAELRSQLRVLTAAETTARDRLRTKEAELADLLIALQQGAPSGAPLPLVHPYGTLSAARTASLTEGLLASLHAERQALSDALATVEGARQAAARAAADLDQLRAQSAAARQALITATAAQSPLPPAHDSEAAELWALTVEARNLADLAATLAPENPAELSQSAGQKLALPLVARPRPRGPGWALQSTSGAPVRAPSEGAILYSGPLRNYRIVQVLELSPGRLLVLAGLGQALVRSGDSVGQGALLGFMPEEGPPQLHRNVTEPALPTGSLPRDTLYMEARDADRVVDLAQWFAVTEDE